MRDDKKERDRVTRRSGTRMGGPPSDRRRDRYSASQRREDADRRAGADRDETREYDDTLRTFGRDRRDDARMHAPREERELSPMREEESRPSRREHSANRDRQEAPQRRQAERGGNPDRTVHQLLPYAMLCLAPFAIVSFVLRDLVKMEGAAGDFGSFLADFLCGILGVVGYAVPFFMLVLALRWRRFVRVGILGRRLLLSGSFLLLLSGIIHVFMDGKGNRNILDTVPADLYNSGVTCSSGGFLGGFFGEWLGKVLGLPGTIILAIPLLVLIGIYLVGLTPQGLWARLADKLQISREQREGTRGKAEPKPSRGAVERTDTAEAEEDPVRADWRQPRPIPGVSDAQTLYTFRDEEDDPIPDPGTMRRSNGADRIDIPDDEPEEAIYAADPEPVAKPAPVEPDPAIALRAAAAAEPPVPPMAPITPPASQPTVSAPQPMPPAQAATAEEDDYLYAPFALPVRAFPKKEKPAPESPQPTVQQPTAQPTPSAAQPAPTAFAAPTAGEEILGADSVRRAAVAAAQRPVTAPQAAAAQAAPAFTFSRPAPVADPAPVQPLFTQAAPAREETLASVRGVSVTPFASYEEPAAPAEETPIAADPAKPIFGFAREPEPVAEKPVENPFGFAREPEPVAEKPVENPFGFSREPEPVAEKPVENPFGFAREPEPVAEKPVESPFGFAREPEPVAEKPVENPFGFARELEPVATVQELVVEPTPVAPVPPVAPRPTVRPVAPRPVVQTQRVDPEPAPEQPRVIVEYTRPPITLLNEDQNVRTDDFYEEIEETKETLRQTMASFNIRIQEEINYSHGPSVTRYEMRPVAGTSVRSVTNRTEDIALNLASSVRIEAPIPGKPAIGIEVPNKVRETVYMRTMLESDLFQNSKEPLEVPLGLDVGGAVRMCNLAKMPHLLVAGTTGSGKSVCINSILVSLIYKTSPEDLRLILIDPKQIEFAPYEHVPHLYMPIVTDMQRAAGALACAVQEMERRFSLIKDVGVRNIEAYNEAVKNDPDREHLPYIIIVIDEFADLKMSCNNNDPENFTCRIAQKARAAGIHLIIGTQRPSVDVITGKLKTNIPSRIAFMVKQQVDSRTILDANGAESLTGRGDMLYMPTNSNDKQPVRIQGAFVSDSELDRVVSYVRAHNEPVQYNRSFMDQIEAEMARAAKSDRKGEDFDYDEDDEGGEDPKFLEAVELAVQTQKVATSLLQRRLGVGYGRAAKIIDRMEELGLVSAPEGNKPRKLLPAAQGYLDHMAGGGDEGFDSDFNEDYDQ